MMALIGLILIGYSMFKGEGMECNVEKNGDG